MKTKQHSLNYRIEKSNFNPVKMGKWFMLSAVSLIVVAAFILIFAGFNLGMDFTGGSIMKVEVGSDIEQSGKYEEVTSKIEAVLAEHGLSVSNRQQQGTGSDTMILVQYQDKAGLGEAELATLNSTILTEIETALNNEYVVTHDFKGPTSTSELILNTFYALIVSALLITIYIAIRFEFFSGLAAIAAQFHDVLLVCAFVLIFRIEINSAFVAALITVMGYSINDTIIVFDRIRDNRKKESLAKMSSTEIVNLSVKQTLVRSINTSISTLLAIIMLAIIGVPSIREFAIPLAVGLIVGTYSSFFIAAPIWVKMVDSKRGQEYFKRKAERKLAREQEKEALPKESKEANAEVKDAEYVNAE